MIKRKRNYQYVGLLYISPWIIGLLLFQLYPFLSSFYYSFTNYNMVSAPTWTGWDNYVKIFTGDPEFYQSLKVTGIYVLLAVPVKLAFALFIAMLLSAKLKGINLFRTVYYLPSILGGSVAISVLWRFLFMKEGVVNAMLARLHLGPVDWLGSPDVALYTLGLLTVWQFGSSMVLFLAGLQQIPTELYEAGSIDGASKTRMFFKITVPLLTPIVLFNLVMQMVNAFQEFTGAFVITGGGPLKSTYLYALKLYEEAFTFFNMGYASALSWVLFVIIMGVTAVIFKSSGSWVHYEDGGR
ncbi:MULTISPECIES: carbohydrate ABC transporter permease [Paenibacillus]|jgi:oligogalacturonide transport system permease protein|uniref:carbohydrate ABC transporter permease n=1 Tax=Paenibacillus TaxID=44249 RepID=UPI00073E578E|nr:MULTISPECIES: sugar ABC transporter permease [Paenibacillus]MDU4694570.1 sugar ABC transporter permease [Paenibacillus sp.]